MASVPTVSSDSAEPTAVGSRDDLAFLTKFTWYLYGVSNPPAGIGPFAARLSMRFTPSADTATLDVAFDLGCRFGTGHVEPTEDGLITVSDLKFTDQSCDSDEVAIADGVVSAFGQPLKWSIQDHVQLSLESADGAGPTLQWRQTPEGTPATEPSTP
jgi:hypothetical protein